MPIVMMMSTEDSNTALAVCSLCLEKYESVSRRPKVLSCYHTYCR